MRLANFKHVPGDRSLLNKWLFAFEIYARPPFMARTFRPYVRIVCCKFLEFGNPGHVDDPGDKKIGGWWTWTSPYGISIEITRY